MPRAVTMRGICAACEHERDCSYSKNLDIFPLQCEQFEMGLPAPQAVSPRSIPEPEKVFSPPWPDSRSLGLCANCDHRDDCIYPKPEGGVWRCEEYQ